MHLAYYTMVALFTVAICCIAPANGQAEERDRDVTELIAQLAVGDSIDREEVAEALAAFDDERITPALTERLKHEEVFHVRMAIHRWLASHGEKASVRKLIDSLNRPGHLGAVHLNRVTGMGYDWNIDRWEKWYKETSEQEYRENAKRRLIPKSLSE